MKQKYFLVLALQGMACTLTAQDTTKSQLLDEVVVTANKYPNKTATTGKVVTVITREQIEQSGGKDLAQVLNEQGGLYVNGANSNPGKDKSLYLRGARIDHTLITIDGIPVYDPSGIGGNFDIRNLPLEQIERIEILKGSQSTLYGSDAIAGVINFITRKADHVPFRAMGSVSYGSYRTLNGSASLEGAKGSLSYRAGYSLLSSAGIDETIKQNTTTAGDRDGYAQQGIFADLSLKPTAAIEATAFFRRTGLKGGLDQGSFTDELDYSYRQNGWQAGLRTRWDQKKFSGYFLYQYNTIFRDYTDDSTKSRNGFDFYSYGKYQGKEHFLDLYIPVILSPKLKWTLGSDIRLSNSTQNYLSLASYGNYTSALSADSLRQNQWSAYTSLHYTSGKNWNAELGGRLNHHSTYGFTPVFNFNPSFLINEWIKIFGNISSGYRTPSLYQLFSEYGNRDLRPERALTTEAGLQYALPSKKISVRLVGFQRKTWNVLFFSFNPVTYRSQFINQDQQKDHGFEYEMAYTIAPGISLRTTYQYIAGKINTQENGKDTTYDNLLRRPRHSANLVLSYRVSNRITLNSLLQYSSSRKDRYFDLASFEQRAVTLNPFVLWDLNAAYHPSAAMNIFINVRNITNTPFTETAGFRTLGRTIHIGFRYHW
jgi:vitamin B12 transporter